MSSHGDRGFSTPLSSTGHDIGLECEPSSELMVFINNVFGDLKKPSINPATMAALYKLDWKRQIRVPFLVHQDPDQTQGIVDNFKSAFPHGFELPVFQTLILRQREAESKAKKEWWFMSTKDGLFTFGNAL